MPRLPSSRALFALIFLACAGLIAFALFLQHVEKLEPCPMCILQRVAFIVLGFVALAAAVQNPRALGQKIYAALVLLAALVGGGIAVRHTWVQYFPNPSQGCAADLGYLMDLPLSRALPAIFRGTADCSGVPWRFLGLSIPEWSLVWFVLFAVAAVVLFRRAQR